MDNAREALAQQLVAGTSRQRLRAARKDAAPGNDTGRKSVSALYSRGVLAALSVGAATGGGCRLRGATGFCRSAESSVEGRCCNQTNILRLFREFIRLFTDNGHPRPAVWRLWRVAVAAGLGIYIDPSPHCVLRAVDRYKQEERISRMAALCAGCTRIFKLSLENGHYRARR